MDTDMVTKRKNLGILGVDESIYNSPLKFYTILILSKLRFDD